MNPAPPYWTNARLKHTDIAVQFVCEELGEQPAIKWGLRCGKPVAMIFVPICAQDTPNIRAEKTANVLARASQELQRCSQNSGA